MIISGIVINSKNMGLLTSCCVILTLILFISTVQGIHQGNNATKDQFTYHAHIDVLDARGKKQGDCNGVVITSLLVLTSYSCVYTGKSFKITIGSIKPGEADDDPAYNEITTKRIYVPPGIASATPSTIDNYIALLAVEIEIPNDDRISKVGFTTIKTGNNAIRESDDFELVPKNNYSAIATGYYNNTDGTHHLQWLNMRVVPLSNCKDFHEDLLNNSLCARYEEIGGSESGSLCGEKNVPLVRTDTETEANPKHLVGILKKADETCVNGGLNLFINVERFAGWILGTIREVHADEIVHIAEKTEFRYHAHIEVYHGPELSNTNNCSGAIINPFFVITSQSCVWNGKKFKIKLGLLKPDADNSLAYDGVLPFAHPDNIGHQGIALLQLEEEILFHDRLQPVILPTPSDSSEFGPDEYAIASGYFSDESKKLQSMNMHVTPISNCSEYFSRNLLQQPVVCVHSEPFAAIHGSLSLCADRGVPLVLNNDRKTLLGILEAPDTSCKNNGQMSLFIDVKRYVNWITKIINEKTNVTINSL